MHLLVLIHIEYLINYYSTHSMSKILSELPVKPFWQKEDVFLHPAQAYFTAHLSGRGVTTPSVLPPPPWLDFHCCPVSIHQTWITGPHCSLLRGFSCLCSAGLRGCFQILVWCANSDLQGHSCFRNSFLFKTPLLLVRDGRMKYLDRAVLFGVWWPLWSQGVRFKCLSLIFTVGVGCLGLLIRCEVEKCGLWGKHPATEFVLICLHILQIDWLPFWPWAANYWQWCVGRILAHPSINLRDWLCIKTDMTNSKIVKHKAVDHGYL